MKTSEEDIFPPQELLVKLKDIKIPKPKEDIDKLLNSLNYYRRFVLTYAKET